MTDALKSELTKLRDLVKQLKAENLRLSNHIIPELHEQLLRLERARDAAFQTADHLRHELAEIRAKDNT